LEKDNSMSFGMTSAAVMLRSCVIACIGVVLSCNGTTNGPDQEEPVPGTSLTVLSPNGGERFSAGDTLRIRWTADTDSVDDVVIKLLLDGGVRTVLITSQFSVRIGDDQWGNYSWVVPPGAVKDTVSLVTDQASIWLHQYKETRFEDYSDDFFAIAPPSQ